MQAGATSAGLRGESPMMQKLRGFAWFLGFCILLLPALAKLGAQGRLPPVVTPGEWLKADFTLPDMREYEQPAIYDAWWAEIAQCEHVILPVELARSVRFVFVNSETMVVDMDPGVYGFSSAPTKTIYIALAQIYNEQIIKHEMLHWLDYVNGIDEGRTYHPRSRFEVCGIHQFYDPSK